MLVLAPAACILAGIAISQAFLLFTRSIKAAVSSLVGAASGSEEATPAAEPAGEEVGAPPALQTGLKEECAGAHGGHRPRHGLTKAAAIYSRVHLVQDWSVASQSSKCDDLLALVYGCQVALLTLLPGEAAARLHGRQVLSPQGGKLPDSL